MLVLTDAPTDDFYFPESVAPHNHFTERFVFMIALLEKYSRTNASLNVLEIGSWCGYSALIWAQGIKEFYNGNGMLTCVDAWSPYLHSEDTSKHPICQLSDVASRSGLAYQVFLHNAKIGQKKHGTKINSIRGKSEDILPLLKERQFDIVYVDGAHSYDR